MERQLHAIYDLIDNYKSKQAVVQCDRLLKKYPSTPIILALKALATYHTGEKEEARRICDFVASTRPTQAPILQPVSMVYKGIGAHRENSEMYERAMTADRMKDEELPAHLFMSLVREGRYKEQQQLALKMSKAYRKPRYTFWAVVSLILQARESSEQAKPMLYTLAERIMIRAKEDGSLQQHEELRLLVDIYTRIQKSQEGLELLRGDLARRVKFDPEFPVKEVEFLLMAQKWDEARDQALSLLSSNPEEWSYVRLYLSACIHQGMNDTERMDALSRVEKQLILLAQQATSPSSKAAMLLGRLEAISRVVKSNTQETPKECLSTLPDLLFAYIKVWCGKESCFPRVHPYLALLEEGEGRKRFLQELSNHIHFFTQNPSKTAHVLALVNESKLRQVLSPDTCLDECLTRARSHVRRYTQLKSIDESAIIFLYMAGSNMLGMYSEEDHHKIIPRAIRLLETGLIDQPQCYQIKLLLVRAYTLAGNGRAALTLYESLGIKNIQCDTLGHFLVDHLPWLLPPTIIPASHIIRASREIYRQNVRDTPEMIVQAYHHGAYSQIEDFIEFRHRLSRSTQQYVTRIQGWVMDLEECQGLEEVSEWAMEVTGAMEDLEGNDQGREGSLEDNRDYQVFPGILGDDAEERASRPRPRIHEGWVRLYLHILRTFLSLLPLSLGSDGAKVEERMSGLEKAIQVSESEGVTKSDAQLGHFVLHLARSLMGLSPGTEDDFISTVRAMLKEASAWRAPTGATSTFIPCPVLQEACAWRMQLVVLQSLRGMLDARLSSLPGHGEDLKAKMVKGAVDSVVASATSSLSAHHRRLTALCTSLAHSKESGDRMIVRAGGGS